MNASRDDAAGKIRVQSNRGGGCQWRREVGPLGRRKAATLTFVEAWNHDNVPEMRERTQQPWAKGTDVAAKKCSQCGTTPRFFAATIDGAPVLLEPRPSSAAQACSWVFAETGNFFLNHTYDDGDVRGLRRPLG